MNSDNNINQSNIESDNQTDFYKTNYEVIADFSCNNQNGGHRTYVDQEKVKPFTCRFCGKSSPEVSFSNNAHALSELIGNKSIFLKCECDSCNERFGKLYENQLASFLAPYRTLSHTKGKNGIPSYKTGDGRFRIDIKDNAVVIQEAPEKNLVSIDNGKLKVKLQRGKYTPLLVFKSFIFMALSIIPENELPAFQETINWLNSDQDDLPAFSNNASYANCVIERFVVGDKPLQVRAMVIRRKPSQNCPYAFFILEFDNLFYQISIPCYAQDRKLAGTQLRLNGFPSTIDNNPLFIYSKKTFQEINLSSLTPVTGEIVEFDLYYVSRESYNTNAQSLKKIVSEKGIKPIDGI